MGIGWFCQPLTVTYYTAKVTNSELLSRAIGTPSEVENEAIFTRPAATASIRMTFDLTGAWLVVGGPKILHFFTGVNALFLPPKDLAASSKSS